MRMRGALIVGVVLIAAGPACVDSVCDNAEDICGRDEGQNGQVACSDDYECSSRCIVQLRNCDLRAEKVRACIGECVASNGQSQASLEASQSLESNQSLEGTPASSIDEAGNAP